jgi:hypothetical protein
MIYCHYNLAIKNNRQLLLLRQPGRLARSVPGRLVAVEHPVRLAILDLFMAECCIAVDWGLSDRSDDRSTRGRSYLQWVHHDRTGGSNELVIRNASSNQQMSRGAKQSANLQIVVAIGALCNSFTLMLIGRLIFAYVCQPAAQSAHSQTGR